MPVTAAQVQSIQQDPARLRNICILAHVDHGKTTLSDSLLATNGIISTKQSGQIRYLDSRPDEQQRGITMKSSAIALHFKVRNSDDADIDYLVNLIDCPGHVDFTSEVSTASRLCDGALVLVDAVEGVCTQTHTVLHQAWVERIKPILVINKVDRLITDLKMTPHEAYTHMAKIIQHANAVMGTFFQSDLVEKDAARGGGGSSRGASRPGSTTPSKGVDAHQDVAEDDQGVSPDQDDDEIDDEGIYFAPQAGNVIFASAIHGWAFRIQYFARLYAAKLKIKEEALLKFLWGEYYLDPKTKRILQPSQLKGRSLKPLAVQFMLDNVWAIYEACGLAVTSAVPDQVDTEKLEKIITALKLKLPLIIRDMHKKSTSPFALVNSVLSSWLPLSSTILVSVIQHVPSPQQAQPQRLPKALPMLDSDTPAANPGLAALRQAVYDCDTRAEAPVVAFLSKLIAIPASSLPQHKPKSLTADELRARRQAILAARGVDSDHPMTPDELAAATREAIAEAEKLQGEEQAKVGAKADGEYDPMTATDESTASSPPQHATQVQVDSLYILMGRDVEETSEVVAGNLFGIGGPALERAVLKSATLSSVLACPSLAALDSHAAPIVRVAVEPRNPQDMPKLVEGLKLLNQSDPAVEVVVQNTGEHVVSTSGELHLERCLVDLRERFAKCAIQVGAPIVPFRETIVEAVPQPQFQVAPDSDLPQGTIKVTTPNKLCTVRIRSLPIPKPITDLILASEQLLKSITSDPESHAPQATDFLHKLDAALAESIKEDDNLDPEPWTNLASRVWALGPKRCGPTCSSTKCLDTPAPGPPAVGKLAEWDNAIVTGFQLATAQGPLCGEPMQGVALIIESVDWLVVHADSDANTAANNATLGQLLSTVRDGCRDAFLGRSPRLLLATYACQIQCLDDTLGLVYTAVAKRRGKILSEEMREGTPYFVVQASMPVVESFGFAEDIRKRTSGGATPQLIFAGYEVLDLDPYWVPSTELELEDLGSVADKENVAKRYVDQVRKRKGMLVEGEKIVKDAEKQRTLKK
ncbi:hypothetical protein BCR44DRAFT_1442420 [Catenaria anguillulae PL171]|uniref:Ribosome assembly protein 1 n=1 Tax=Catenaria anguillulae PL171 TaxID=765915 RepID=A0A1Y2HA10_9FUNG|nr:hypothetical protein BCR44DRAFT_1442420 [Catenaria anguillulae PL171]